MSNYGFRLNREDYRDFSAAQQRVLELLSDGKWHSRESITLVAGTRGIPASEGTKRLRELRPRMLKRGYAIPCRRLGTTRASEYRLMTCQEHGETK